VAVIRNEKREPLHAIGILDDISDRKQAEEKIIKQNKDLMMLNEEMDQFVYRTSHDLRAPLSSVLGLVHLMKTEVKEEIRQEYIQLIERSIKRLDGSIHEILDLSRNNRLKLDYRQVDLQEIIENVLSSLAHLNGFDKLKINTKVEGEKLISDQKRLMMTFNNLLSNAISYHNPNHTSPFININCHTDKQQSIIVIEDNGHGFDEKHKSKIFDMFYRATDQKAGSGLGLYIVKEAVTKLGGTIKVSSALGKGTTFTLIVPNNELKPG
jgi:signal transduction histidine kinase